VVGGDDHAFDIKAYTLIDAEVGIVQHDGKWNVKLWGKNIANTYYWNNTSYTADVITKLAGMPATYGISAGYRF
jgi:iron complex outermembrane recepter protein